MKYITIYYKKTKESPVENFKIFYTFFAIHAEDIDATILKIVGEVSSAWY